MPVPRDTAGIARADPRAARRLRGPSVSIATGRTSSAGLEEARSIARPGRDRPGLRRRYSSRQLHDVALLRAASSLWIRPWTCPHRRHGPRKPRPAAQEKGVVQGRAEVPSAALMDPDRLRNPLHLPRTPSATRPPADGSRSRSDGMRRAGGSRSATRDRASRGRRCLESSRGRLAASPGAARSPAGLGVGSPSFATSRSSMAAASRPQAPGPARRPIRGAPAGARPRTLGPLPADALSAAREGPATPRLEPAARQSPDLQAKARPYPRRLRASPSTDFLPRLPAACLRP